jgi:hypothetical protein
MFCGAGRKPGGRPEGLPHKFTGDKIAGATSSPATRSPALQFTGDKIAGATVGVNR